MTLPIIKSYGVEQVFITCDKDNIASSKVMQKNGVILKNEVLDESEGRIIQIYCIQL